ncbi:MAG: hypothetical protein GWN99_13255 [Gemmatimonadetes bacterium]|uniref:PNPLA domain-containing protein n=1 Tax=Candidatus Kutchimonas denitrificans TaxID=3056748 RepID=A0AAE4ZB00_9BACT|nr:hypothetical protein [Gemmatimonadota bacterium]NIR75847.1 hypothetical protein [Candidatus Kutchimonas denitrificans]NIS02014.1 hypothetical protein [Gemmatimonadota bacterium]NIT67818.1 hypothetical protein [Gemmatimonadota bacterium]NIU53805.1 hypothetical protein [Gemmatimonadota bacterium]
MANGEAATGYEQVKEEERKRIGVEPACGLAISGGGIRSASFGLGVLQALVRTKILKKVDYLSTVSGGGYIGSSLTWFLKRNFPDGSSAGLDVENFPFGARLVGGRTGAKRNDILDYIRQHASYLTPGRGLNLVSLIGVTLRSLFVSLFVYFAVLVVIMWVLHRIGVFQAWSTAELAGAWPLRGVALNPAIWLAALVVASLAILALVFSVRTLLGSTRTGKRYARSIAGQRLTGRLWVTVILLALVGSLPYAAELADTGLRLAAAAGTSTVLGVLLGVIEFIRAHQPKKSSGGLASGARVVIGAAALIYGLLLGAYALADSRPSIWWFVAALAVALLFGLVVNLNYVGLHRMYRDRLMETFLPDAETVHRGEWEPATGADYALLEEMCDEGNPRPYHLINTNVVLVDSPTSRYRGRGGDNFILSPLFCGSDATGWRSTDTFMKTGSRGMTLATAMAISGAAVNPHTGVAGKGLMRNRLVAALMSLLNLRLGYWIPNPSFKKRMPLPPNFLVPGLSRGVLGRGFSEDSRSLELSDGGHFENLGLYELIRRQLSVIIASDAGADPEFRFGDLENALERARVDFGARIRFRPELGLEDLLPGSATGVLAERFGLARRGYAIADITYHDGSTGTLFYIKSVVTPNLPADLYGYKSANPAFPDQTTADQFFDEEQFEAYRELGYQLAKATFAEEAADKLKTM